MKTRTKLWIGVAVGLLAVVGVLVGVKGAQIGSMIKAGKSFVPPPEAVTTAAVESARWQPIQDASGTLVAFRGVTVGTELPGTIREIGFDSGTFVRKGAMLVRLDTTTEEAQLASAKADENLARLNYERAVEVRKGQANTPADLDAAEARYKQAQAAVRTIQAAIDKKTIRAPFDGRIAIRQVELGQVLGAGAPVASIQSVTPIHVEFSLPQQALARLKVGQPVHVHSDTFPGATWNGKVSTVNTEVDVATRNVKVRATVPNDDGRLRPGMFASVEVLSPTQVEVLVVPATAVLYAPYGDSVYVVEKKTGADGKEQLVAQQRFVRLGERRGDLVAVENGLKAGEMVVSSGAFKLRSGATVTVRNDLAPDVQANPKPANE
ncbi:MAG TPA: efflux RND transporter periplasmic adaptor subunit [Anaeromyxobacteraceae bacterium]|nr:efflux RND transporter periplasmic adaptor subunit [Anaeromyxobacteraceae bacterium]